MNVVILNPSFGDNFVRVARWAAKSRGRVQRHPEYLLTAAQVLIDAGHEVHYVEAAARNFTAEESIQTTVDLKPELLVMHITTPSIYADIEQAKIIKDKTQCRVVFVGQHATAEVDGFKGGEPRVERRVRHALWIQLLLDVGVDAHLPHALDVARPRAES